MKKNLLHILVFSITATLVSISWGFIAWPGGTKGVEAQSCCTPPKAPYPQAKWPKGTLINVKIQSGVFLDYEKTAIEEAIQAWHARRFGNCSNVSYSAPQYVTSDPPQGGNVLYVRYSDVVNGGAGALTISGHQSPTELNYSRVTLFKDVRQLYVPSLAFEYVRGLVMHEIGHPYGLDHFPTCSGPCSAMCDKYARQSSPTACDDAVILGIYCPTPTPTPVPRTQQECVSAGGAYWSFTYNKCYWGPPDCPSPTSTPFGSGCVWKSYECTWTCSTSPVLVDVSGDGFSLTDAAGGVNFDLDNDGAAERLSWTAEGSDDAWLALDRDGDGRIEDGGELFGDITAQPEPPAGEERNGFLALAEYDRPEQGGDGDGVITERDAVFSGLRLWQDVNHNGVSEPEELHTLPELGLRTIELDYKESRRTDGYGNQFRYRAKVRDARGAQTGRWAWDVFLVRGQ